MKPRVYLETTIPSYLTAWPSRDLVRAAHQQITREWWQQRRSEFELHISQVVLRECQAGDPTAAAERLETLEDLPLLEQTEEATKLAQALLEQVPLPDRAAVDALHIAVATVHGMDTCLPGTVRTLPTRRCAIRLSQFAEQVATSRQRSAHWKNYYCCKEIERGRRIARSAEGSGSLCEALRLRPSGDSSRPERAGTGERPAHCLLAAATAEGGNRKPK